MRIFSFEISNALANSSRRVGGLPSILGDYTPPPGSLPYSRVISHSGIPLYFSLQ